MHLDFRVESCVILARTFTDSLRKLVDFALCTTPSRIEQNPFLGEFNAKITKEIENHPFPLQSKPF